MTPEKIDAAAALLRQVRADFRTLAELPEDLRPHTAAEGYAIQDAFARDWDAIVGGWKIACTAADQRELLGVDEPFCGRVYANVLLQSPAELPSRAFHMRGLEAEFAFRMARDIPPRDEPYGRDEVAAAVASLHPAIEVVDCRFEDWLTVGAPSLIADSAVNGALICGEGETNWTRFDLAALPVRLDVDGQTVGEGTGGRAPRPSPRRAALAGEQPQRPGHHPRGQAVRLDRHMHGDQFRRTGRRRARRLRCSRGGPADVFGMTDLAAVNTGAVRR